MLQNAQENTFAGALFDKFNLFMVKIQVGCF